MSQPKILPTIRLVTIVVSIAVIGITAVSNCVADEARNDAKVAFAEGEGRVAVVINGMPVAVYCYEDKQTLRPYFEHVRTLGGLPVTRNHPPIAGFDVVDHDTLHPGIWLAFGSINGLDFWRNKATVKHASFVKRPSNGERSGSFCVRNEYLDPNDPSHIVCNEVTQYTFVPRDSGYFILWDTRLTSDKAFTFGDQQEMGLGIRMATPLRVGDATAGKVPPGNGKITNSAGAINEKAMWGDPADWCDFSGSIAERMVGATICCHPGNIRPSRFHARDYGLLTANAFGQNSFKKGDKLETTVQGGEELRLRYGIYIHDNPASETPDFKAVYEDYLGLVK